MFRVFSVRQAAASPAVPSAEFLAPKGRGQHAKRPPPKKLARRHDSGFTAGVSSCLLSDLGSDMRGRKRMERRAQLVAMRQPETPRSGLRAKPANPCRPSAGVRPRAEEVFARTLPRLALSTMRSMVGKCSRRIGRMDDQGASRRADAFGMHLQNDATERRQLAVQGTQLNSAGLRP